MNHKTRLGPIAIFLIVIAMVITTMGLLSLATSNADRMMAGRFASVTSTRYQLEADGERFISDACKAASEGSEPEDGRVSRTENGYLFYEELNGYSITAEITAPDSEGRHEVVEWKISKLWDAEDPVNDIWPGF